MKDWEMTYTKDRENFEATVVTAPTYTMALLQFVIQFPNCECTRARELNGEKV